MSQAKRRLRRAVDKLQAAKQDRIEELPGLVGITINGIEVVNVPNRDSWIYVRVRNNLSEPLQVYNDAVNPVYGLAIKIIRETGDSFYRVKGRNVKVYETWGGLPTAGYPVHASSHEANPSDPGNDIVHVYKPQIYPLALSPMHTGTSVEGKIRSDFYVHDDELHYWPGSGTVDLTAAKPTSDARKRFLTVSLDGDLGIPYYTTGELFVDLGISNYLPHINIPDLDRYIPLGAVLLHSGSNTINDSDIIDIRPLFHTHPSPQQIVIDAGVCREPVTNGNTGTPDLVYAGGDVVMAQVEC
jgi:hypothetical protein